MKSGLILVTGFLGAGKTTFIRQLLKHFHDRRVFLIINEFGRANVDSRLLADEKARLYEIDSGSIFCACRLPQFEEALATAQADAPDYIIVETSGLSDPTAITGILSYYPGIDYLGCVALADALNVHKVLSTALVVEKQLLACSLILLSKTDLADEEQIGKALTLLTSRFPEVPLRICVQGAFEPVWLSLLAPKGRAKDKDIKKRDLSLQRAGLFLSPGADSASLLPLLLDLAPGSHRVKGIVSLQDGVFLVDCVGEHLSLTPFFGPEGGHSRELTMLAGPGLPLRKTLQAAQKDYPQLIEKVVFQ